MNPSPKDADQRGTALYVITLASSSLPMPLDVPFRYELTGFTVFRSRSFEHGRESFRLHLGYFESARHAEDALTVVRKYFPAAQIFAAPQKNLGSLDNTLNTEFRLLRTAFAHVVKPVSGAPAAAAATLAAGDGAVLPAVPSPQYYAVQLKWSLSAIVAVDVPRLAIFKTYYLYTVRMPREGSPQHGLRLGFFNDADAARQVAEHVRPKFPEVGVVPVSHREYSRAIELARQRALRTGVGGTASSTTATTRESEARLTSARTAESLLPATQAPARQLVSPLQKPRTGEVDVSRSGAQKLQSDDWRDW
jgi:hypothetical protein